MNRSALVVLAAVGAAVAAIALIATASATDQEAVIDFEGLTEGAVVSSVDCSGGVTCTADPGGSISVFGLNPALAGNQAMIFDSDCVGGCSGGVPPDDDLNINQGNVLIISEDGDSSDPDDGDVFGSRFDLDFSAFGEGTVAVTSIDVADIELEEGGAFVDLFAGPGFTGIITSVPLPQTGDGNVQTVAIGVSGVASMQVVLNGSGAIDNLRVRPEHAPPGGEGCTPGFWRNHLEDWGPTGLSPGDDFDTTFGVNFFDPDKTLDDTVRLGGGGLRKVARHGTAALLNALHPDVNYPFTAAEVIAAVQAGDVDALVPANELSSECPAD
jgi:hypothetical protein